MKFYQDRNNKREECEGSLRFNSYHQSKDVNACLHFFLFFFNFMAASVFYLQPPHSSGC